MAKRLVLQLDRCIGCRACEAACRSRFKSEARVRYAEVGATVNLPMVCRHCTEPLCASACPFDVIVRGEDGGVVRQASYHCVGCRSCALACPFGVIDTALLRRVSQKCSLCADRAEGPRCAATCPTGALLYEDAPDERAGVGVGIGFVARSENWRRG
jgi:Fe-S-cluster-containing hydrogenase component 2